MSRLFLTEILRNELGFKGVITTDDIGMGAVSALFEKPGAAAGTVHAGCDLLMMSSHWGDTNRCIGFAQEMLNGLENGAIDHDHFDDSHQRIDRLLSEAPTNSIDVLPDAVLAAHRAICCPD
jgi:beta-N-acetylhexosaminidase